MILHPRKPDIELLFFRALSIRTTLDQQDEAKLNRLEKGYEGELAYDEIYDQVINHLYTFRNIYLKVEDSILQIDSLIVTDKGLIVHEIKNFQGQYEIINNNWTIRQAPLSSDPVIQLKRTANKLHSLNYLYQENMSIIGKLIFTNIEFYFDSQDKELLNQMVMRNQLRRYFHELKMNSSTEKATNFANYITNNIVDNPFFNRTADLSSIKKGVYCLKCHSFNLEKSRVHFICKDCHNKDTIHTILLKSISDYHALFHKDSIRLSQLYDFINQVVSRRSLLRVINKYCTREDKGRGTSYTFDYNDFEEAINHLPQNSRYIDYSRRALLK